MKDLRDIIRAGGYTEGDNTDKSIDDLRIFTSDTGEKKLYPDEESAPKSGASVVMNNETGKITVTVPEKWMEDEEVKSLVNNSKLKTISGNWKMNKNVEYQDPYDETKTIKTEEWLTKYNDALQFRINALNYTGPAKEKVIEKYGINDLKKTAINKLTTDDVVVMSMGYSKDNSLVPLPAYMVYAYPELKKLSTFKTTDYGDFVQKKDFMDNFYNIESGKITEKFAKGIATAPKKVLDKIEDLDSNEIAKTIAFGNFISGVDPKRSNWDQFLRSGDALSRGFYGGFYDWFVGTSDLLTNVANFSWANGNTIETRDFWNGFFGADASEYARASAIENSATDSSYAGKTQIGYVQGRFAGQAVDTVVSMMLIGEASKAVSEALTSRIINKGAIDVATAVNEGASPVKNTAKGVATEAQARASWLAEIDKMNKAKNAASLGGSKYKAFFSKTLNEGLELFAKVAEGTAYTLQNASPAQLSSIINAAANTARTASLANTAIGVLGSVVTAAIIGDKDLTTKVLSSKATDDETKMWLQNLVFETAKFQAIGYSFGLAGKIGNLSDKALTAKFPNGYPAIKSFAENASQKVVGFTNKITHPWLTFVKWFLDKKTAAAQAANKQVSNSIAAMGEAYKDAVILSEARAYGATLSRQPGSYGVYMVEKALQENPGVMRGETMEESIKNLASAGVIIDTDSMDMSHYQAWKGDYAKLQNWLNTRNDISSNVTKVISELQNPDINPTTSSKMSTLQKINTKLLNAEQEAGLIKSAEYKVSKRFSKRDAGYITAMHSDDVAIYAVREYELKIIGNEAVSKGEIPEEYEPYKEALERLNNASEKVPENIRNIVKNELIPSLQSIERDVMDMMKRDGAYPAEWVDSLRAGGKYGEDGVDWLRLVARKEMPKGTYNPFDKKVEQDNILALGRFKVLDDKDITWIGNGLQQLIIDYAASRVSLEGAEVMKNATGLTTKVEVSGEETAAVRVMKEYRKDFNSAVKQGISSFVESSKGTIAIGKTRARMQSEFYENISVTGAISSMDIDMLRSVLKDRGLPMTESIVDQESFEKFYDDSDDHARAIIDNLVGPRGSAIKKEPIIRFGETNRLNDLIDRRRRAQNQLRHKRAELERLNNESSTPEGKTLRQKQSIGLAPDEYPVSKGIWDANRSFLDHVLDDKLPSSEDVLKRGVDPKDVIKEIPYGEDAAKLLSWYNGSSYGVEKVEDIYDELEAKYSLSLIPGAEKYVDTTRYEIVDGRDIEADKDRVSSEISSLESALKETESSMVNENNWPDFWKNASKNVKDIIRNKLKDTSAQTGYGIKGQILERLNAQVPGFNILDWSLLYREHTNGLVKGGLYSGMDNVDVQAYIMDIDDLTKMLGKKYIPTYTDNVDVLNEIFSKNVSNYTNSYNKNAVIPAEIVKDKNGKLVLELSSDDSRVNTMDWSAYLAKLKKDGVKKVPIVIARSNSRKNPGSISKFIDKQNVNAKNITSELSDAFSAQDKIPFFHGQSSAHDNNWYGNIGYNDTAVIPTGEDAYTDNNGIGDAYWLAPNSQYTDSYGDVKISGNIPIKYFMSDKERVSVLKDVKDKLDEYNKKMYELGVEEAKRFKPIEKTRFTKEEFTKDGLAEKGLFVIKVNGKNTIVDIGGTKYVATAAKTTGVKYVSPTDDKKVKIPDAFYEKHADEVRMLGRKKMSKKELSELEKLERINPDGNVSYRALAEYTKKPVIDVSIAQQKMDSVNADGTAFFYYKGVSPKFDEELGKQLEAQANAFPKEYDVNSEESIEKFIPKDMTAEDIFRKIAGDTADYDLKKWYSYIEKTNGDVFADRWFGMFIDGMTLPYQKKYPNTVRIIRSLWSNSGAGNNDLSKIKFGDKIPHIDGYDGVQVFLGFLREMGLPAPQSQTVPEESVAAWNAIDPRSDNIPDTLVFKAPKGDVEFEDFKAAWEAGDTNLREELFKAIDAERYNKLMEYKEKNPDKYELTLANLDRANAANNSEVRGSTPVKEAAEQYKETVRTLENTTVLTHKLSYLAEVPAPAGSLQEYANNNGISYGKNVKEDVKNALWEKLINGEEIPEIKGLHIKNIQKDVAARAEVEKATTGKSIEDLEKSVKTLSDELTDLIKNHGDKEKISELEYELSLAEVNLEMAENNTSFEAKNEDYPGWAVSARLDGNMQLLDKLDESNPKFSSEGTLRDYYRDYQGKEVVVVEMPAASYTKEIQDFGKDWGEDSPFRDSKKIDKYLGMFRDGKLSPLPVIGFDKNGKVIKQEGRHRTEAADIFYNEQGKFEEKIPVIIEYPKGSRPKTLDKYKDVTDKFVIKKNTTTDAVVPEEAQKIDDAFYKDLKNKFFAALDKTELFKSPSGPSVHKYEIDREMLVDDINEAINDMIDRVKLDGNAMAAIKGIAEKYYKVAATDDRITFIILGELISKEGQKEFGDTIDKLADDIFDGVVNRNTLIIRGNEKNIKKNIKDIILEAFEFRFAMAKAALESRGEPVDSKAYDEIMNECVKDIEGAEADPLVIRTKDVNGETQYEKVSPAIAKIYTEKTIYTPMSKPMQIFANFALFKKINTTDLSPRSFAKQAVTDPVMAFTTVGALPGTLNMLRNEIVYTYGESMLQAIEKNDPIRYKNLEMIAARDDISMLEALKKNMKAMDDVQVPFTLLNSEILRQFSASKYGNEAAIGLQQKTLGQKINSALRRTSEKLGKPQNIRETYNRILAGSKARLDALGMGYNVFQADIFAEYAINTATTNFRLKHTMLNKLRATVPYATSGISGAKSFWRMFEMDPVGVTARIYSGFICPIMFFMGEILKDNELTRKYKTLAESEKENHIVIAVGGELMCIPVGEEMGKIVNLVRNVVETIHGMGSHEFWKLMLNSTIGLLPGIDLTGFTDPEMIDAITDGTADLGNLLENGAGRVLASAAPPLIQTYFMVKTGRDLYTGKKVKGDYWTYDEDGNPVRMNNSTSEFAKALCSVIGGDSKVIEKVVSGVGGIVPLKVLDTVTSAVQFIASGGEEGSLTTGIEKAMEEISRPFTYYGFDDVERWWNNERSELFSMKEKIRTDKDYININDEISKTKDPKKRQGLINNRNAMLENYQYRIGKFVENYKAKGGSLDRNKFNTVVSLMTFQDALNADRQFMDINTSSKDARNQALQTLYEMGIKNPEGTSTLGYVYPDAEGNPKLAMWNPVQMQIIQAEYNAQGEIYTAHLKALINDGTDNSISNLRYKETEEEQPYWDKYNSTGKLSNAEWDAIDKLRKDFNTKVVVALQNYMNAYGAANILSKDEVIDYLEDIIKVPSSYERVNGRYVSSGGGKLNKQSGFAESYIKSIFGVK